MIAKKDEVLIAPLGGLEQIGANSTMIGHNKEWLILDLGIAFHNKYGIEILTPDISIPMKMKNSIKGIFVTHAHEDHIGAIPYLWEKLQLPIYVTEFPAQILKQKFSQYSWKDSVEIHTVKVNEPFNVGGFNIEYIPLAHSVLGACGIYIKTAGGNIFYTGDWKIDETPLLGDKIDVKRMEKMGQDGIDCLLCDSTNILTDEVVGSENDVRDALKNVFKKNKDKRITVTCFASNLARIETIFHIAKGAGRKIAVIGRSMHKMIDAISHTSYFSKEFKTGLSSVVSEEEAVNMPASKVVFICTGSQGELRAALFRIARNENKTIKLNDKDVVVFSSKVIPGNELGIRELQNLLVKNGVELITTDVNSKIHVSGHPSRQAVAEMYKWTKPKTFIPIHGDPCMLYAHEKFAREHGIGETIIAESGDVIALRGNKLSRLEHRNISMNCIDGNNLIPLDSPIIKERAAMSCSGHMSVSFMISSRDTLTNSPDVSISGIYIDDELQKKLQTLIYQSIINDIALYANNLENLKSQVQNSMRRLMSRYCDKKPVVSVHIHKC